MRNTGEAGTSASDGRPNSFDVDLGAIAHNVGVVPLGFADGLAFLTCGAALVRGVRAPILGNLSLEHVCIDVTGIPDVAAGDEVVFIGRQAAAEITQEEVMARQRADLPPASLAAAVRETVPRVYRPANSPPSPPSPAAGQRYTPFVESANERLNGLAHDVSTH